MKYSILGLFTLCCTLSFAQQKENTPSPNYQLAAKYSPSKLRTLIPSTDVKPNWINYGDNFWYEYSTTAGKKWYLVNPASRKKSELFDNAEMAAKVTSIVRNPFDAQHLPIQNLRFMDDENLVRFEVQSTKDTVKSKEEIAKLTNKKDTIKRNCFTLNTILLPKNSLR